MEELNFTWQTGLKLFVGILILGIWFLTRQQAQMDHEQSKQQEIACQQGEQVPQGRIISKSNLMMVGAALIVILIALFLGNESTI